MACLLVACLQPDIVGAANLLFEDDFNTPLDTTKWTIGYHDPDTGDVVPGAADRFLLNYNYAGYITEEDVRLHGGSLHLLNQQRSYTGRNGVTFDYTSGQVMSLHKFSFNTGYVEWKAKFPSGQNMWPSLWLIAEDLQWGPEWDAFEYFGTRRDINAEDVMGMHLAYDVSPNVKWSVHWQHDFDATFDNEAWHVYGFEWTANEANWYVDGQLMRSLPNTFGAFWPDEEMFIVMNNGILSSVPGDPADFPNSLIVDYVRVWDSKPPGNGHACDFNGDAVCDILDLDLLQYDGLASQDARYDLTDDGLVDLLDRDFWLSELGTVVGDFNLDGKVNTADLNDLGINWQKSDAVSYSSGDANGDGRVATQDLNDLAINWQFGVANATTVPEASLPWWVIIGILLLVHRSRRPCEESRGCALITVYHSWHGAPIFRHCVTGSESRVTR